MTLSLKPLGFSQEGNHAASTSDKAYQMLEDKVQPSLPLYISPVGPEPPNL